MYFPPDYVLRCFVVPCWNSHTSMFSSVDEVKLSWPAKVIMQFTCILKFPLKAKNVLSSVYMIGCGNWASLHEARLMTEPDVGEDGFLPSSHLLPACVLVYLHPKCQQACQTRVSTLFVPSKSRQGCLSSFPGWVDLRVHFPFPQPFPDVPCLQCM